MSPEEFREERRLLNVPVRDIVREILSDPKASLRERTLASKLWNAQGVGSSRLAGAPL